MLQRRIALMLAASLVALTASPALAAKPAKASAPPAPTEALYGELNWRLLGPFRGGWGEMVEGIPTRPDSFLFGAAGGGVWRTDDAGRTWQPLFEHGPAAPVGSIAVAPSDPNVIYIGTGQVEPRYDIQAGLGVFRSSDGGRTWSDLGLKDTRYVGKIWVDPSNADTVLVGAQGHFFGPNAERGLFRSTNGGKSWTQALKIDDGTGVVDIASDPKDPKVLFAAAWQVRQYPWQSYFTPPRGPGSAVYKSTDGGVSWSKLGGEGWPTGSLGRISLAATHTAKGTRVYAVVDSADAPGMYRSDDGGAHWIRANAEDAFAGYYASRIAVQPDDPDVVFTVGQSIRRCTEAGKSCTIFKGAPGGDDYHHVWINPLHPDHIATASDQGTVVSVNGGKTWSSWYNQPTGQFYHLATDNRFPYWVYSGQQDSGTVGIASRSDYGSLSYRDWHPVGGDERDYDIPDPNDPDIVYASGLGGHVTRWDARTGQSEDVSAWPMANYGARPTTVKYHYNWVTTLVASETGPTTLYLGAQVVFASKDGGHHWSIISPDLVGKVDGAQGCDGNPSLKQAFDCGYGTVVQIAPSPRHADEIWTGSDSGLLHLTRDGGAHWTNVTPPGVAQWAKIASVDVSAIDDGTAYVAVDGQRLDDFQPHAYATHDYGKTWREIASNLPRDHFVSVVRADPVKPGLLYAGTDHAMFVSFDDGARWSSLQQNLPTVWMRDVNVHGDDLVLATQGRSIWVLDDVTALRQITPELAGKPAHLFAPQTALRVHPNNNHDTPLPPEEPVGKNPPKGAIIDYWLGADAKGPVEIDILDAKGQLVNRLTDTAEARPDAERYFSDNWVKPGPALSRAAGMHRAVWSLRYPRPPAIGFQYSIAAVYGEDTPVDPEGAWALPGDYTVVLKFAGKEAGRQPMKIALDPRVRARPADLEASLDFSRRIDAELAGIRRGYGETGAAKTQLSALGKLLADRPKDGALAARVAALNARLSDKAAPDFSRMSGGLATLEAAQEAADAAPTAAQLAVFAEISKTGREGYARWSQVRDGELKALNADLKKAKLKPVSFPAADRLVIEPPAGGQDMP